MSKKETVGVHYVKCHGLPLCITGCDTARDLGHPTCGARSLKEAERTVKGCEATLRKAGLDPKDYCLTIVEGHCPESIKTDNKSPLTFWGE